MLRVVARAGAGRPGQASESYKYLKMRIVCPVPPRVFGAAGAWGGGGGQASLLESPGLRESDSNPHKPIVLTCPGRRLPSDAPTIDDAEARSADAAPWRGPGRRGASDVGPHTRVCVCVCVCVMSECMFINGGQDLQYAVCNQRIYFTGRARVCSHKQSQE